MNGDMVDLDQLKYLYTRGNHETVGKGERKMQQKVTVKYENDEQTVQFGLLPVGAFFQWGPKLYIKGQGYNEDARGRGVEIGGLGSMGYNNIFTFSYDTAVIKPHRVEIKVFSEGCEE